MSAIPTDEWKRVGELYIAGQPMRAVAERYDVSIDAVVYVLRKTNVPRRNFSEANRLKFEAKSPSFRIRPNTNKELEAMGAMLYWAEGYKTAKATGIDFANCDPEAVSIFWSFLKDRYILDQKRVQFGIFYYSDQNLQTIIDFWCKKLSVSPLQFKNHYMTKDPQTGRKKMDYGVMHVRYYDKKLLRDVLNLIESYKGKYASVG